MLTIRREEDGRAQCSEEREGGSEGRAREHEYVLSARLLDRRLVQRPAGDEQIVAANRGHLYV